MGSRHFVTGSGGKGLLLMAKTIGLASEFEDVAAKGETIQQAAGQPFISQHPNPFAEGQIGGDEQGDLFAEGGAELEQELGAAGGKGHISQFIEDDELVTTGFFQKFGQAMFRLRLMKVIDQGGDGVKAHAVVLTTGGKPQSDSHVRFAQTGGAHEEHRFGLLEIMALGEGQDFLFVELGQGGEVEVGQFLAQGEMSFLDASLQPVLGAAVHFFLNEGGEIGFVRPSLLNCGLRPHVVVLANGGEMQGFQVCIQGIKRSLAHHAPPDNN